MATMSLAVVARSFSNSLGSMSVPKAALTLATSSSVVWFGAKQPTSFSMKSGSSEKGDSANQYSAWALRNSSNPKPAAVRASWSCVSTLLELSKSPGCPHPIPPAQQTPVPGCPNPCPPGK